MRTKNSTTIETIEVLIVLGEAIVATMLGFWSLFLREAHDATNLFKILIGFFMLVIWGDIFLLVLNSGSSSRKIAFIFSQAYFSIGLIAGIIAVKTIKLSPKILFGIRFFAEKIGVFLF